MLYDVLCGAIYVLPFGTIDEVNKYMLHVMFNDTMYDPIFVVTYELSHDLRHDTWYRVIYDLVDDMT